ncbi:MAG: beta-ketoacyl-[acyl-carrier-protein] synthase family protein [Phycisphaerae bacterium]|nr:beta-ketoacyl-[acyl-carrier-protein] synthase family protein [Phycisphaerae bacterium]
MSDQRRVVVTGLGVATPVGIGVDAFWDALLGASGGIRPIAGFDASALPSRVGGELPSFTLGDYIPKTYRKSAKVMSRDITVAVVAAYHAVRDAGLKTKCILDRGEAEGPANVDSTRFGANIGAGLICADLTELAGALASAADADPDSFSYARWGREGMEQLTPLWLLKFLPNMLACHVTIVHDAQAPSNTVTCGEASSYLAIGEAFRTIARGDADVCICGGAESKMNPMGVTRPTLMGWLNTEDNDDPERACRPFAADRRGAVAAEGGGLVILESLEHARARSARIYAEVAGFGAASSTHHWREADPSGHALASAVRMAMRDASVKPEEIDLVVPMGTGIKTYDAGEMSAWRAALPARATPIPATTIRGAVGNCGAGVGAMDFAAAALCVHHGTVVASRNTAPPDADCPFTFREGDPADRRIRHAVVGGYALAGGQSAALVIKQVEG